MKDGLTKCRPAFMNCVMRGWMRPLVSVVLVVWINFQCSWLIALAVGAHGEHHFSLAQLGERVVVVLGHEHQDSDHQHQRDDHVIDWSAQKEFLNRTINSAKVQPQIDGYLVLSTWTTREPTIAPPSHYHDVVGWSPPLLALRTIVLMV